MPLLSLGTAQFGMKYGITNKNEAITEEEAHELLQICKENNIQWIDTAQAYGTAESKIGKSNDGNKSFRIIDKIKKIEDTAITEKQIAQIENDLDESLKKLRTNEIDGLLLHSVEDLHKEGRNLLKQWLIETKKSGKVKKLGVSIYEAKDISGIEDELLDIVQIPLSVYDQRLLKNGTIKALKKRGIEIHARSIYMQGLILQDLAKWPGWVDNNAKRHHEKFEEFCLKNNKGKLEMAVAFAKEQSLIDAIIIGISKKEDLIELLALWKNSAKVTKDIDWNDWAIENSCILDPRTWPKSK